MKKELTESVASRWARAGVLLNVSPSRRRAPDLERLLLDTARECPAHARLFILAVTWLAEYGSYVAAHRLKRLAVEELEPEDQATLGLLIETAVEHGAPATLRVVTAAGLETAPEPGPLFEVDCGPLAGLIEKQATAASLRWGRWIQPIVLKRDALRTAQWILRENPAYAARAAHKGDLRTSIVETLRRDVREPISESELARRCGATITAVRSALRGLELELPGLRIERCRGRRGTRIALGRAA